MKRLFRRSAALLGVLFVALLGYLGALHLTGNFHTVSQGTVYRSAQLDGQALVRWTREHGIATVLNLRGENAGEDWYEAELAVTERLGLNHIDFRMSAQSELAQPEVERLLQVMRDAPKPLLIHCQGGADRTGLAAALYVAGIEGRDEEAAEAQLSLTYGHIGIPWLSKAWPMNVTWERIEPWLGFPES